jgi:hypothetical protein
MIFTRRTSHGCLLSRTQLTVTQLNTILTQTLWNTQICSQSQSQSHIATDGQSVNKSWCQAPSGAHDQIFIAVWQLESCFCGAPSLPRGQICLLYMLLALASAVFLGSSPLGLATTFYCLQFRLPFSSPPTTRRVTVKVFNPASTQVKLYCTVKLSQICSVPVSYIASAPTTHIKQPILLECVYRMIA